MTSVALRLVTLSVLGILLAGCGGGGDSGGSSTPNSPNQPPNVPDPPSNPPADPPADPPSNPPGNPPGNPPATDASAGGIWRGTESSTGYSIIGLIDESGDFRFIRVNDGVQYVGTASITTNAVSAGVDSYAQFGTPFIDGSTHAAGTVSGTVQERTSMSLTYQLQSDAAPPSTVSGTLDITFDALYNEPSSLATISGNYTNTQTGVVVSIATDGTITSQDPTTQCVVNGQVSIVDATYNLYGVTLDYASCIDPAAALNGLVFKGLATLDDTGATDKVILGVTATTGTPANAMALSLDRT